MKAIRLTILLVMLVTAFAFGQESKRYQKLKKDSNYREGYIITRDSSEIKGLLKLSMMNEAKMHSVVNFVHLDGTKKTYYPGEIKGYGYSLYKFISANSAFFEVIHAGNKVSLYKNIAISSWSTPGGPGMHQNTYASINEGYLVKKNSEGNFMVVRKKNFKEDFSVYFGDCEIVKSEIMADKLTHTDIEYIVKRYNYCK